jgi:hypothetical protein
VKTKKLIIIEGREKMRKLSCAAVLVLLLFAGCMQESSITEPINGAENNQAKTIIMLPDKANMNVEDVFTISQNIDGTAGGELHLVKSYVASDGQTINIDCRLTVPAENLSFADTRNITMEISNEAGVDFYPTMTFDQPVILNYTISGLDLNGVNPNRVQFYYVDQNGNLAPTINDGVSVNISSGTLKVINAQLPHFSRWAYAR